MVKPLALIAEGGGARGAYVYGAMAALEEVFNDQHGLANFAYMAGTSASALTMMYALSGQFHSDGKQIWLEKVAQKRFMNALDLSRLFTGPPILDVAYLVDEVFEKQHPLAWRQLEQAKSKFYIPLIDAKDLSLKFYTNDTEISAALLPYDLIFMDRENPGELYAMMKAASAVPVFFNQQIEIQGAHYIDGALLAPLPLTAPIPSHVKRICILTKAAAPKSRWIQDRLMPSIARSGFFQGHIDNKDVYSLIAQENPGYKALLKEVYALENTFVIKPQITMSSSDNKPESLRRNMDAGYHDVIKQKETLQAFLAE